MPLTVESVINFVPSKIWRPLKKFVTKDETVVFDLPFKMSTKYTPGLLLVLMCLSFANQIFRDIELDCAPAKNKGSHNTDRELSNYCWNYETFLVVKALKSEMRQSVTYPGVSGYDKKYDDVLSQRYYKYVWIIFCQLAVISFLPYFFWKSKGVKKIKPLVVITESEDYSEEDERLKYFLETTGFNEGFAWSYVTCKIFGTLSPLVQWYFLIVLLGKRYKYYGIDVLNHVMGNSDPWPNPMDVIFPKMAKCEWSRYGFSGDIETISAQCLLPMNNITQWSFFVYWFWMAIVFFVNILSLMYIFVHMFSCFRRYRYRKFIETACREDVEKLKEIIAAADNSKGIKKKHKKNSVHINMGFGDWLVLSFMKKNLEDWKFRDFLRKMATTKNAVLQLKTVPVSLPSITNLNEITSKENPNDDEQKVANIGFKPSIISPYSGVMQDLSNQMISAGSHLNGMNFPTPIRIAAPVRIDRKNVNQMNKTAKAEENKNKNEDQQQQDQNHANYGWNQVADQDNWE